MQAPLVSFPAHWAPNDMVIYNGTQFPEPYRGGAFIAFHGSWNRAPGPQGGYNVVFLPLTNGKAWARLRGFADGFAGAVKDPSRAAFRPTGLAVGPDGALYMSDDVHGRIWRITYNGSAGVTEIEAAPSPGSQAQNSAEALPTEGIHPEAGNASRPSPCRPARRKNRSPSAIVYSTAKSAAPPAPGATVRTPRARRSGRI